MTSAPVSRARRPDFWWGLLSLLMLLACAVLAIVNLAISRRIDWAQIPLGAIALLWGMVTPLLLLPAHKVLGALGALTVGIIPFLLMIQRVTGTAGWVWPVAFPIVCVSLAALFLALWLYRYSRVKFFTATGIVLLSANVINWVAGRAAAVATGEAFAVPWISLISTTGAALLFLLIGMLTRRRA